MKIDIPENIEYNYLLILRQIKERSEKCFTQKELADIFGMSRKTFSNFYVGKNIKFELLINLAAIVGYDINFEIYKQ